MPNRERISLYLVILLGLITLLTFGGLNRIFGLPLQIQESLAVVIFGIILGSVIFQKNKTFSLTLPPLPLVAFLSFALISLVWTDYLYDGILKMVGYLTMIGAAWALAQRYTLLTLLKPIYLTLCVITVVSLVVIHVFPGLFKVDTLRADGVWIGLYGNKQSFAFSASLLILLAIAYTWYERRWWHSLIALCGVLILLGADSRGALLYICLVLIVGTLGLYWHALRPFINRLIMLASILIFAVFAVMIMNDLNYLPWITDDATLNNRTVIWHYTFPEVSRNLMIGLGFNGFWSSVENVEIFLADQGWVLEDYHNGFLSVLVECGVAGVGLWLLILAKITRDLSTTKMWFVNVLLLLFFVVLNMTESFIFKMANGITFVFFLVVFRLALEASSNTPSPLQPLKSAENVRDLAG